MDGLTRRAAIGLGMFAWPAIRATVAQEGPYESRGRRHVATILEVAIAVPNYGETRPIVIGPGRHFHVVVSNLSDRASRLWDDHCAEGAPNLSFEVVEGGVSHTVRRADQDWAKNFPIAVELLPGDQSVSEVTFDPGGWELPWAEFESRRVRMRAIYEIKPSTAAEEKGVWTGKIASRYGDYTLHDNRR